MTIFTEKAKAVKLFRTRFENTPLLAWLTRCKDDELIWIKLLAGEDLVAERLRVFLEPTQIFCADNDNTAAIAALNGAAYWEEPGYDYNPDFFRGNSWGMMKVRRKPIIAVQAMTFVYNNPDIAVFQVPSDWIRLDKPYGMIRLLPVGDVATLPLNSYLLSAFGGGRTIPNMIRINYTSGIENIQQTKPALVDFIYRVAAFSMISDLFPSGSSSISIDGMSQTDSFAIKDYGDSMTGSIEGEYKRWFDKIHGIRCTVV